MGSGEEKITVEEGQDEIPSELREAIESGEVVDSPPKRVISSLVISIIAESPPRIDVQNNNMNPYMIPTLLKQLAQNFEDGILKTRSLLEK